MVNIVTTFGVPPSTRNSPFNSPRPDTSFPLRFHIPVHGVSVSTFAYPNPSFHTVRPCTLTANAMPGKALYSCVEPGFSIIASLYLIRPHCIGRCSYRCLQFRLVNRSDFIFSELLFQLYFIGVLRKFDSCCGRRRRHHFQ